MREISISQGTVVTFVGCGGQDQNHRSEISLAFFVPKITKMTKSVDSLSELFKKVVVVGTHLRLDDKCLQLDMANNTKKSNCLRIGQRHNNLCVLLCRHYPVS